MFVASALRSLGNIFNWLWGAFYNVSINTQDVYLIGTYLSSVFMSVAGLFDELSNAAYIAADEFSDFYNWVVDNLGHNYVIAELIRYADDLINFIKDPFDWIRDIIRDNFPELITIANDPIEWFLETLWRYTGLTPDFTDNPLAFINNIINSAIGNIVAIINDPVPWLSDLMNYLIPDYSLLFYSPADWVRSKFEELFPWAIDLISDPDDYIQNKLESFLDELSDRYIDRVLLIAERILQNIF